MCKICEINKKLGIPNYLCLEKIQKAAKKTKQTKITDMILRKRDENGNQHRLSGRLY